MEEKIGKASLRDAAIGTGIALDKMLALTGETPALIVNVPRRQLRNAPSAIAYTDRWTQSPQS